jgi:hypothetical protein
LFGGKWMELETIMLNKISQAQKDKGSMRKTDPKDNIYTNTNMIIYIYFRKRVPHGIV